jgi:hypothetical protein
MLLGVTTRIVGIETKVRALQIIINAQIDPKVEEGGQNNEDIQGRRNEEHGGRSEE